MADRGRGDARGVHGGPRHNDRQRRSSAHRRRLSSSNEDATWALTSYLVANGIVLTISGWLGDLLGRKRYFLICIAMFTVCSFLCGIASSLGQLIFFRLAQGFFGGGLQPNRQSIILDTFPPAKRGAAFGVAAIAIVVAPVLGPTLGGYITDNSSGDVFPSMCRSASSRCSPLGPGRRSAVGATAAAAGSITSGLPHHARARLPAVMMDRGEDDDWFGSTSSSRWPCSRSSVSPAPCSGCSSPEADGQSRRVQDRNFAPVRDDRRHGRILYASAVMIPQFAQHVLGYTATWAGLILSPGGMS